MQHDNIAASISCSHASSSAHLMCDVENAKVADHLNCQQARVRVCKSWYAYRTVPNFNRYGGRSEPQGYRTLARGDSTPRNLEFGAFEVPLRYGRLWDFARLVSMGKPRPGRLDCLWHDYTIIRRLPSSIVHA